MVAKYTCQTTRIDVHCRGRRLCTSLSSYFLRSLPAFIPLFAAHFIWYFIHELQLLFHFVTFMEKKLTLLNVYNEHTLDSSWDSSMVVVDISVNWLLLLRIRSPTVLLHSRMVCVSVGCAPFSRWCATFAKQMNFISSVSWRACSSSSNPLIRLTHNKSTSYRTKDE